MKRSGIFILFSFAALFMAATPAEEQLHPIREEALPIIDNILQSFNAGNYKGYLKDFNDSMRAMFHNEEIFKQNNKLLKARFGEYVAREFWKINKMNQHYIIYYKVKFSKLAAPVTVRLVLERIEEKLKVAFLSFNPSKPKAAAGQEKSDRKD